MLTAFSAGQKLLVQNNFGYKGVGQKNYLVFMIFFVQHCFGPNQIIFRSKKCWVQKNVDPKEFVPKKFGPKKKFGKKN